MKPTRATLLLLTTAAALASAPTTQAKIRTQNVSYQDGQTVLVGFVAYDDSVKGRRPGVLVFHQRWGLNDHARTCARYMASLGYVALAADLHGGGWQAKTPDEAERLAARLRSDRALMRSRGRAALRQIKAHKLVDDEKVAAIGFGLGGTAALELARSGADLRAAVSFHGPLIAPKPDEAGPIRAKVLLLHGGADGRVFAPEAAAFRNEMRAAGADWQMITYGAAAGAFTDPNSAAYNDRAARRAWTATELFLAETIGLPRPEGDARGGIGWFLKDKVGKPIGTAGKAAGKAVGTAGKATGKAVKKAATWTWEKLRGKDGD